MRESLFYSQVAQLLDAGITLSDAIHTLSPQFSKRLQTRMRRTLECLNKGEVPWKSFEEGGFDNLDVTLIEVAEQTGDFPDCFRQLALHRERMESLENKIKAGLAYPLILLLISPVILNLPLLFTSAGLIGYLVQMGMFYFDLGIVILVVWFIHHSLSSREPYQRFLNGFPVLGRIREKLAFTRFFRALSSLLESGVEVDRSVKLASEATNNLIYRNRILSCLPAIVAGESLHQELERLELFPAVALHLIETGERSGSLPESLSQIEKMLMQETEYSFGMLVKILPVVVYLLIASYLAIQIGKFYSGLYMNP